MPAIGPADSRRPSALHAVAATQKPLNAVRTATTMIAPPEPTVSAAELEPGQTRKEEEGVFALRNAAAVFIPVKTGIAGDKYFEVLSGLKAGDLVITGPFNSVRDLKDGDAVKPEEDKDKNKKKADRGQTK